MGTSTFWAASQKAAGLQRYLWFIAAVQPSGCEGETKGVLKQEVPQRLEVT